MADTPAPGATAPNGETASQGNVSNDVSNAPAPVTDNGSTAEVERLRKEAEQATMRANQLANQLESKTKAEEAAKQKQMEDKEEFKQLYEQLKQQIDERDARDAERERQATLQGATQDILKEYPQEVQELATTAGLSLNDDSDEAKKTLTEKLDAFKARVVTTGVPVTSNNTTQTAPVGVDRQAIVHRESSADGSVMAMEAAKGNLKPTYQYISSLPAIQRMKEIAQGS